MKIYNHRKPILVMIPVFVLCVVETGCSKDGREIRDGHSRVTQEAFDHDKESDPDRPVEESFAASWEHDIKAKKHENNEMSDLDRPVEELFAASCEHDIKAHECDDCRYEVGVVKAVADLFDKGLLEQTNAEKRSLSKPLEFNGEVRFDKRRVANISSQAAGIIRKAHVTIGDHVVHGQPLVTIESPALGKTQAEFLESKVILETAGRNYDRIAALGREGISSGKELLAAKTERDVARVRKDAAFNTLARLGMNTTAIRRLDRTGAKGRLVLLAPFDGTVLDIQASTGELVRPELNLVTVADNSVVWVWVDVYERDIAPVMRKQAERPLAAEVEVNAFPREKFNGTLDFISPSMNKSSRTAAVRIIVPNPDGRLFSGMFARVKILMPGGEKVLSVPSSAVLDDEDRHFVFVHYQGDHYVRRPVTPGRNFAGLTEIKSGLTERETIVAKGAFLLKSDVLRSKMGAGCAD